MRDIGLLLIAAGVLLLAAGVILYFGPSVNFFRLGRLPGDIHIDRGNVQFYFPITTSIVVSLVLTLLLYLFTRLR